MTIHFTNHLDTGPRIPRKSNRRLFDSEIAFIAWTVLMYAGMCVICLAIVLKHYKPEIKAQKEKAQFVSSVGKTDNQLTIKSFTTMEKTAVTDQQPQAAAKHETVFPDGLLVFEPHRKAPEWVKSELVINIQKFVAWANGEGQKYLKNDPKYGDQLHFTIKDGKKGLYISVNTYAK